MSGAAAVFFIALLQRDGFGGDARDKSGVVLDEQDGRRKREQQGFNLHAREDVDKIQRLVPHQQVRFFAQAFGDEHFFFARR